MGLASLASTPVGRAALLKGRPRLVGRLASVPAFFLARMASGLLLLKLSTSALPVGGFTLFSQLMLFAALLNAVAVGGAQSGVIRQTAAAEDDDALARTRRAAMRIWGATAPCLALLITLASAPISHVLVGNRDCWWVVITIALLALSAGPGQIWCSVLTGRQRAAASLLAQAIGLFAGTGAAAWAILHGDPIAATIGFASGPLVTMAAAFLLSAPLRKSPAAPHASGTELRALLRYSAAFAATTGFSSLLLFGLRSLYREDFSTVALGYWLVANRISDMSTQLLGLFMIQVFVPHFAMLESEAERRALTLRFWAAAVTLTGAIPIVFSLISGPLVRIFLSPAFAPAIPAIRIYMIGDMLRVWASLAMHAAFAKGHPERYAAIEMGTLLTMAVITAILATAGDASAPMLGYACAYGLTAALVSLAFLRGALARA